MPPMGEKNAKALTRPHSARSDPELLQKLLHFVRTELRSAHPDHPGYIDERLGVFRRAFGHFIASYGTYAPLLTAVQEAYESALHQARAGSAGVEAMSERLALMQSETRNLLDQVRADAAEEYDSIMKQLDERDARIAAASAENEELRAEVGPPRAHAPEGGHCARGGRALCP